MALASFVDPSRLCQYPLYQTNSSGNISTALTHAEHSEDGLADLTHWFNKQGFQLPPPRNGGPLRPIDFHLASWIQHQIESSIAERLSGLLEKYDVEGVCVAGGVALNSVLNRHLEDALKCPVFVPPSPGDSGLALGAVSWYLWKRDGIIPQFGAVPYLGPKYSSKDIERAIKEAGRSFSVYRSDSPTADAAAAIRAGKVIAWFSGRSEFGPRALGNRSILVSPQNHWTKDFVNHQVKGREWFRPYAPSVIEEIASEYFKIKGPVPYMMKVAQVRESAIGQLASCVHVDRTARLQTVTRSSNPAFYELLSCLESEIPAVLNTSFNIAGMPIVESPVDAIDCFSRSGGLELLFLEDFVLSKR